MFAIITVEDWPEIFSRLHVALAERAFRFLHDRTKFEIVGKCCFFSQPNVYLNAKVSQPFYIRFFFSMVHLRIF